MEFIHRFLLTAVSAASLIYVIVKISHLHWKNRGILHEKPKFFWGNLKGVGSKRHVTAAIQEVYRKYHMSGPYIGFYAFIRPLVLILDIQLVHKILCTDEELFVCRGPYSNVDADPISYNLTQLNGNDLSRLNNFLSPILLEKNIKEVFPTLMKVAAACPVNITSNVDDYFAIRKLVEHFNVDVISYFALGTERHSIKQPETAFCVSEGVYSYSASLWKTWLFTSFPNLARLLQVKPYNVEETNKFLQIVTDRIRERARVCGRNNAPDFLRLVQQLITKPREEALLSNDNTPAEAFSFLTAGLDSYTATVAFCLYELALHPDMQGQVRREIRNVLQLHKGSLSVKALHQMTFLKQVLFETLRKYSPYPVLLRHVEEDYEIFHSTLILKKGNLLIVPVHAIHNDPRIYPDPEKFDPDRFLPDLEQECSTKFLPYGCGVRGRIALNIAQAHMMFCLVTLLRLFIFAPCSETVIPMEYDNTKLALLPKSDIKLQIRYSEVWPYRH